MFSSHFYIYQNWTWIVRFYCLVDVLTGLQSLSPHSLPMSPETISLEKTIIFNAKDIFTKITDL